MIRALIVGLIGLVVAAFLRSLVQMIFKEMGEMVKPGGAAGSEKGQSAAGGKEQANASLKKCVVCGTYTTPDRMLGGSYCSAACQEKARAA
ncbi:MAG: hypothetical protein NW208_00880 [Bryobacter sp.]|nr:hypothetical protein [Bryobacter sp.]